MIIDDGDVITAGGILAWTDLGLLIVEKLLGQAAMLETARFLIVDPPRKSQTRYMAFLPRFDHGDKDILQVQHHMHASPRSRRRSRDWPTRSTSRSEPFSGASSGQRA